MDNDLDTDNDMDKIFNIITSIRGKKKRPDRDFICREAESLHGLNKEMVSSALDEMVRADLLYVKESYFTNETEVECEAVRDKLLKLKSSALKSKHSVKQSSDELDAPSARAAMNKGSSSPDFDYSMAPFWLDTTIFQTASQLSKSVANLNELLSKERDKCHRLMQENLDLQSKLRHDGNLQNRSRDTLENESDNRIGPSIVFESTKQTTNDNRSPNSNRNSRKAKNRRQRRMRSSMLNSANKDKDRSTNSSEQVNNSEKSKVQVEINTTAEALPSTTIAPTANCNASSDNTPAASQSSEVATISSVKRKGNENVNNYAATPVNPDSVASDSSSNAINEQLSPSDSDTWKVIRRNKTQTPSQERNKRTAVIMGDSLIKNINGWELKEKCGNRGMNIFVKNFNGATTRNMYSYAQPSIERKPNLILLHSGTNDLSLKIDGKEKTEVQIAEEIINLAKSISDNGIEVIISGLITRGDRYESKRKKVNFVLQDLWSQNGLAFLEHSNIHANKHLNRSQIHLNQLGDNILGNNLLRALRI